VSITFNPFTGRLDFVGPSTGSSVSKSEVIKSILLDTDYTVTYPVARIVFDEDSILYNDDEAL
jgi:hypothetical protein